MDDSYSPSTPREHFCKDCRYWYGADTAASFGRGLSAPYRPQVGPWGVADG